MDPESQGMLDELQCDPYPHYDRVRRTAGLSYVAELDAWLVARDADVREVLRRPGDFSSANSLRPDVLPAPAALAVLGRGFGGRPVVVTADGARHQQLCAPLVRGLSPARVAAVLPYAAERAAAVVDGFAKDGRVELMSARAPAPRRRHRPCRRPGPGRRTRRRARRAPRGGTAVPPTR